jgi:DNA-directed RNA polymerase, mitochondrial
MHSDNIVGRLREEFQTRYQGYMYMVSVLAKSPVGEKISAFRKQKKIKGTDELAVEAERIRLLNSEDEHERAMGRSMLTPGSILAAEGDESAFAVPAEIADQQLGTIPENAECEAKKSDSADTDDPHTTAEAGEGVVGGSVLDTDAEATDAAVTGAPASDSMSSGERVRKPKKVYHRKMYVWMPLTFPDVPPKGEFDVRKIRESNYFFH